MYREHLLLSLATPLKGALLLFNAVRDGHSLRMMFLLCWDSILFLTIIPYLAVHNKIFLLHRFGKVIRKGEKPRK